MGTLSTPEALIARWGELCGDPSLDDLPYKVELAASGKLELSPKTTRRGLFMADIGFQLQRELPEGVVAMSCAVLTATAVRIADVVWASRDVWPADNGGYLLERAPELCVEVCSPESEEKVFSYLAAGAREVWIVSEDASIRYFDRAGERATTGFPIQLAWPPAKDWV